MQKTVRLFTVFLFVMLFIGISGIAEEITLTTYYPAPYGAYNELTTTGNTYLATTSGNVGIGTTGPGSLLTVQSAGAGAGQDAGQITIRGTTVITKQMGLGYSESSNYGWIQTAQWGTAYTNLALNPSGGRVGIGTTNPTATLHVAGSIIATGDATVNRIYTGAATTAHGQGHNFNDIAEYINVRLEDGVEPGDVVTIDNELDETVTRSSEDYDLGVAGVISSEDTAAFIIGKDKDGGLNKRLLALAGRVPAKVTTINGPIKRGDILTTSSIPGHAMKATDREKSFGAIVGKALEPFDGGPNGENTGKIIILVTLQ